MTPLQQAAQAVIDRWDSPLWKDEPPTAVVIGALRKALADEQAQAVEPVARVAGVDEYGPRIDWYVHWANFCGADLYTNPPPTKAQQAAVPAGSDVTPERAAFFMRRFKKAEKLLGPNEQKAIDYVLEMLEADTKAQQVAVPAGYAVVQIEPTEEMIAAADEVEDLYRRGRPETWGLVYKAMLAAAQGANK